MRSLHPLVLLLACLFVAAALTHVLPAGKFERRDDPATGRQVVVAGTYQRADPAPVGPFQALVAIPRGLAEASGVIFFVFLVGGGFTVVEQTGASTRAVQQVVARLGRSQALVIPLACAAFGLGGVLIQMSEELLAFVPVLLLLTARLGYPPVVACAVSIGASAVGAAFSPVNPFQVVIAQKVAGLPVGSGLGFRLVVLLLAMALWTWGTMRFARRERVASAGGATTPADEAPMHPRDLAILGVVLTAFVLFIVGARRWGWDFPEFSALFFVMGAAAGLLGQRGIAGTADGFVEGFRSMAYAAMLIGFARAIFVVLDDGRIIDTIVQGLFAPIAGLPLALSAIGMMGVQAILHIPVPSTSGQAVLTMPVLTPLSDLLGLSRQVTVLAYQYGAGLTELLSPTNGTLMALLAATGVRYSEWLRLTLRLAGLLFGLGACALLAALALGV